MLPLAYRSTTNPKAVLKLMPKTATKTQQKAFGPEGVKKLTALMSGKKKPPLASKGRRNESLVSSLLSLPQIEPDASVVSSTPKMVKKRVSPAMAERYLRSAAKNRNLDGRDARKWCDVILRGKWQDYHPQGWAFDKEGHLIEGQHRAAGLIKAGEQDPNISIGVWLSLGNDRDVQATIDTGRTRTMAQTAQIIELEASSFEIAITKALWISPEPNRSRIPRVTDYEKVFSTFNQFRAGIKLASQKHSGQRSVTLAAIRAVIARAYYHCHGEDDIKMLSRFIEVMDTGLPTSPEEHPPALLRIAYTQRSGRGETENIALYRKAITAVDAFMKGNEIKRLSQTKKQIFPLPDFEPDAEL